MSLINQMLQELDARRAEPTGSAPYGEQVRAVPERRRGHPAWWAALAFASLAMGLFAWLLLRPDALVPASAPAGPEASPAVQQLASLPAAVPAVPLLQEQPAQVPASRSSSQSPLPSADQRSVAASPVEAPRLADAVAPVRDREEAQVQLSPTPVVAATKKQRQHALKEADPAEPRAAAHDAEPSKPSGPLPSETGMAGAKRVKELTPQQQAENAYRKALTPLQQGKMAEAVQELEHALALDPRHAGARHALIGALLESKRSDDALRQATEGLTLDPAQADLAMIAARLQLDKGELKTAIDTLERTLPSAVERADYLAFLAALLQRDNRHKQAVDQYLLALQKSPQNGIWWMGLGISLQASQRLPEAREAFSRAKSSNSLSPELLSFVNARLTQLQH